MRGRLNVVRSIVRSSKRGTAARAAAIAEAVRACIRAAWLVTGGDWRHVQITVLPAVAGLTRSAGVPLGDDLLAGPFLLPRRSIERDSPARPPPGVALARRILRYE
jgi:hypothetical protein